MASNKAKISSKDLTISSLNTNITQLQQSLKEHQVDKDFLILVKAKVWEQNSQEIKTLIQLWDHIEPSLVGLRKLEMEVGKSKNIFDPNLVEAKRANEKLNKLLDKKLKALDVGDHVELMVMINYPMQGKRVSDEIKDSVLN